jgi:hypothetical protein
MLTPYKLGAGLVVFLLACLGSLYGGYQLGTDLNQAKHDAALVAKKAGEDAALKAAAEAIARIEVKSETHIQPVRTEIRTNTVYRDCQHSPDSLRHLNSLISGDEPAAGGLPEGDTAR